MSDFARSAFPKQITGRGVTGGFTLVELLVVLAIIAIVAALSLPVLNSLNGAFSLDSAGQGLSAQFTLARQTALATSHPVEICFFQIADYNGSTTNPVYRAMQCFQEGDNSTIIPVTKPYFFPATVKIFTGQANGTTDASSLLDSATYLGIYTVLNGDANHVLPPPYGKSTYTYIRIRSNGQIDQSGGTGTTTWTNGWLTLAMETAPLTATGLPANYVTVQINSVIGSIRVFRP
jgi:type IV fimbrial biogenesis protein FimT